MTSENEQSKPLDTRAVYGDVANQGADEQADTVEAMESLIAGSRITKGTVMDDQKVLTDAERDEIRARWRAFRDAQEERPSKQRVSNKRLSREIAEKESTISQVLNNNYPKSKDGGAERIDQVLRKVDQFLDKYEKIERALDSGVFAWTGVAIRIKALVETTVIMRSIGVCYGAAGIGKTSTLTYLLDSYPGSFLVTMDERYTRTVGQFMGRIGDVLGVGSRWTSRDTCKLITGALKDSHRLCMIDEAHLATAKQLNALRQLHDECGIPIFLMGMPALQSNLMRGRGDDSIGATLYSRVQISYDLEQHVRQGGRGKPLYSMEDIRKVFSDSRLRIDPSGIRWLHDVANDPNEGGLRCARAVFRLAKHLASQPDTDSDVITYELLEQAAEFNPRLRGRRMRRASDDTGQTAEALAV